ncbi:MAG: chemotaxis protein CheX [Nitrospina sp.]|nr:chemotaxis protein CheX [Nitrospina sp.]
MQFLENELSHCAEMVWNTLFGMALHKKGNAPLPKSSYLGCATRIRGAWNGWLVIHLPPGFSNTASRVFFGLPEEGQQQGNIEETLKEIANQIGGNIKHLVPQPSTLDTPLMSFNAEELDFPNSHLKTQLTFECEGDLVEFRILESTLPN